MKKLILVFVMVLFLTGCMNHIEDTNGEDTSLETFTIQEKLDSGSFSSRSSTSFTSCSGGTTYATMYEEIDCGNLSIRYNLFSGVDKVHATEANDGDSFTITIDITHQSGNLEVVLVNPNDEILGVYSLTTTTSFTVQDAIDGIYFVIIGGESAEFEIDINRTFN